MITTLQFSTLDELYQFYNEYIFDGQLPECIVNMSRKGGSYGFFVAERWRSDNMDKKVVHEISINPDYMDRPDREWHSTLVHEMCHLWQQDFGNPSRRNYHNKQWAAKMMEVGLMPSDTGEPGGKTTGQQMGHYIIEGGKFEQIFNTLEAEDLENLRLKYRPRFASSTLPVTVTVIGGDSSQEQEDNQRQELQSGKRVKYTCGCGNNVWGRAGLWIKCEECNMYFLENE